jgi:uncharacterized membrane protein
MRHHRLFGLFAGLACALVMGTVSHSAPQRGTDLMVCNSTGARVALAVVSYLPQLKQWTMDGWTFIGPQTCQSVGVYDRGQIFYYAEQERTGKAWPGPTGAGKAFCIANQMMKRLATAAPCPTGERLVGFVGIAASGSGEQRIELQ